MSVSDRWLSLQVRHLEALKAVAEETTFAAAAARLGYTQSAVSQQIAALERIVGRSLLERPRGRRPTGLTDPGRLVLRHGEAILARVEAVQADIAAALDGDGGSLRVGTYQSIGRHVLPELLPRFSRAWPRVDVQLRESASDYELLELVERAELDLTFCMLPLEEGPFAAAELFADPYVLVLPRGSALAAKARLTGKDVVAAPLIAFRSCRNHHRLEAQLGARGLAPTVIFRSDDNGTVQALVAAGLGAALMPRLTVELDEPMTACRDVSHLFAPRAIGIVWHRDRDRTPAATAFVGLAKKICAALDLALPSSTRETAATA
jgi:DNA-binding transcriptional LysR family regulator